MNEVTTIGLDIARHVFHAHGADAGGRTMFGRKITRGKLLEFFASHSRCVVALEACGGAHHWARELRAMGYEVRRCCFAFAGNGGIGAPRLDSETQEIGDARQPAIASNSFGKAISSALSPSAEAERTIGIAHMHPAAATAARPTPKRRLRVIT